MAWKMKSPWNAARRLNSGVNANWLPVPNGEPAAGFAGYKSRSRAMVASEAPGK